MIPLLSLMTKELRQTFRDRRMLALLLAVPVIQLLVLGFAVNLEVEQVATVVADLDHTPQSRALAAGLTAGDAFVKAGEVDRAADAVAELSRGAVPIAVVTPTGLGAALARGRPAQVQILVDGGDSNRAIVAQNAAMSFFLERALSLSPNAMAPPLTLTSRVLYNPTLNSQIYFVPGVAATLLLVVILIVTAMGVAREREMGTLEQVLVTPMSTTTLALGKTLPYAVIGLIDLGLVLGAGSWIFSVPIRGELWLIFAAGLLYLLALLALGLTISTLARNQQQALMSAFLVIQPAILLSGFMTPIENMPAWLQPLTAFNPVRHFIEVLRGVLLKGASLAELKPQLVALAAIGGTLYAFSAWLLKRRLA